MQERALLLILSIAIPAGLAGCIGGTAESVELFSAGDVELTGRIVELNMWVETHDQEIYPGYTAALWAFCIEPLPGSEDTVEYFGDSPCSVPGPTLRLEQGDRVVVNFRNPHDFPHTVHWHGQLVPWESDGVPGATQDTVIPGSNFVYEYVAARSGTLMYHCHVDTQHHVFMGLYGAVIVEPQDQSMEPEVDKEFTLVLSHGNKEHMRQPSPDDDPHAAHRGPFGTGDPNKQNAPFNVDYDIFMINGHSFPTTMEDPKTLVLVDEGDRVRIRLLNIGFLAESMHLHGHDMLVTHKDGMPLAEGARFIADTLRLDPGERYDVVVEAENPGKWVFHTHYPNHVTNDHQYPGGMLTQFVYTGFEDATFRAEKVGGMGASMEAGGHDDHGGAAADVPDNFSDTQTGAVTDLLYDQAHTFPVESTEALKVEVVASLSTTLPAVDELTVTLLDADGAPLAEGTLSEASPGATLTATSIPNTGTYTVQVSGRGVEASYGLAISVIYSEAMADDGHDHEHG